ncbi:MAPEG family protein [Wenzhouxiangella sp. EGI_FJ10409]|uniref:MAPEG family protein n=1 Tax=Wenzhouxiangella sp. EGI_FJ10409 TaxID=3243767 RepID=UPI0035E10039
MALTISMFYAGLLVLLYLALSLQVVRLRRTLQVGIGTGGNEVLDRAVRAHANFAEYVPLALLLLVLVEAGTAAPAWLVHLLGAALLVGRVMHGLVGLNRSAGYSAGRFWGTCLTWLVFAAGALIVIVTAVGRWMI